jgi:hypothetical protein
MVGFNTSILQVEVSAKREFLCQVPYRNKRDGFEWILIPVYGVAQDSGKPYFLEELFDDSQVQEINCSTFQYRKGC